MNRPQASIFDRLSEIIQDVFDNDDLVAIPTMTADDVEGWDSLANVQVFLAIEQRFGVRFNASEISSIKNLGELAGILEKKSR